MRSRGGRARGHPTRCEAVRAEPSGSRGRWSRRSRAGRKIRSGDGIWSRRPQVSPARGGLRVGIWIPPTPGRPCCEQACVLGAPDRAGSRSPLPPPSSTLAPMRLHHPCKACALPAPRPLQSQPPSASPHCPPAPRPARSLASPMPITSLPTPPSTLLPAGSPGTTGSSKVSSPAAGWWSPNAVLPARASLSLSGPAPRDLEAP